MGFQGRAAVWPWRFLFSGSVPRFVRILQQVWWFLKCMRPNGFLKRNGAFPCRGYLGFKENNSLLQ